MSAKKSDLFAWTCPKCSRVVPMRPEEFPIHCRCGYVGAIDELGKDVPIVGRAVRYAAAIAKWVRAGRPVRARGEVKTIFEAECKPCDRYDAASGSCGICHCNVNASGKPLRNKIRMATESCPLGKW